jgi:sulfur relay (sulfurtransferase) DsrF/TusC family protein
MAKKILQIVESAYRGTLEEQDDTVVWLTHAMKGAGGDLTVLLRGNAVNYAVKGQDASGLAFGDERQTQPPRIDHDLAQLAGKGVAVYVVEEDVAERGIDTRELIEAVESVRRATVPKLMDAHDLVWHW